MNNSFEKISPTAWGVAYHRALAEIKYAKEIFEQLEKSSLPTDPLETKYMERTKTSHITPQFEARYKLINRLIRENKTNQILEIASGLSPRGLEMTDDDLDLAYVEVDILSMADCKRKLLEKLFESKIFKPRTNLCLEDGDALDVDSLLLAANHFKEEPITVINEGLLRYMNFDQKAIVAENVRTLLEKFGGAWITSDITLARILDQADEAKINRGMVKEMSGIDIDKNVFASVEVAIKFFEGFGFTVEKHSFMEVADELISPQKLSMGPEQVYDVAGHAVVFVMRLKK
ncbi:MAG: class I SAM-dependent methyltransferase [Candidatus Paceibacterota bacterium]|jgi:O-methyltransferase involved in polyketide biosynthesis